MAINPLTIGLAVAAGGAVQSAGRVAVDAVGSFAQILSTVGKKTDEKSLDASLLDLRTSIYPGVPPGVENVREYAEAQLKQFYEDLRKRFESVGIDLSQPFRLQGDFSGQVRVSGDRSDREAIEAVLLEDPALRDRFQQLDGTFTLLNATETALSHENRRQGFGIRFDLYRAEVEFASTDL